MGYNTRMVLGRALARLLGRQTERLARLDVQRRFEEFRSRWCHVPLLDFSYEQRETFYRHVHDEYIGDGPMDYLEFGCWQGESMRAWSGINRHPQSRFFGFDSFEGLPEDWDAARPRGTFSVQGRTPELDDPRVQFIKGWFTQTLPSFVCGYQPQAKQVLHLDADLYGSTLYALMLLNPPAGTILLFDEFGDYMHEFRAFEDYRAACGREYEVLGARPDFHKIAIRLG